LKFSNLVFGFVIFSVVLTLIFTVTKDLTNDYGSENAATFDELAGKYDYTSRLTTGSNSTIRTMDEQSQLGIASSEDKQIVLLSGAVSAVRLITNIFPTIGTIIEVSYGDAGGIVPRIIIDAILGIILVFLALVIIHMFMRMKSEV